MLAELEGQVIYAGDSGALNVNIGLREKVMFLQSTLWLPGLTGTWDPMNHEDNYTCERVGT